MSLPQPLQNLLPAANPYEATALPAIVTSRPELIRHPASGRTGLSAWIAVPEAPGQDPTPLVTVHGIKRAARDQVLAFAERAQSQGRPVIAPEFDEATWPRFQQVVRKGRADLALLALLDELAVDGIVRTPRVDLFGYSGGAQFAHRFAMIHPQRVRRLGVAAAGWYTFPEAAPFPYGMGVEGCGPELRPWGAILGQRLPEFLTTPITVLVGSEDRVADEHTRRNEALDRMQGIHRLARARAYVTALIRAAAALGLPSPDIRLEVLKNAGHDFKSCVAAGLVDAVLPRREITETHQGERHDR